MLFHLVITFCDIISLYFNLINFYIYFCSISTCQEWAIMIIGHHRLCSYIVFNVEFIKKFFLQTIFKKKAKKTDLLLSSSTQIGLLQNLRTVKELKKVDIFLKIPKCFFLLQKTFHTVQSHYVTQIPIYYKIFCQFLLNQDHYRNIHCNTALFHTHVCWSISLGCNTNMNLCQI